MPGHAALIVAAGRGSRFGGPLPKQYRPLGGRPLLHHCLAAFAAHPRIDAVRAVIDPDHRALYDDAARGLDKLLEPVAGGPERQDSVRLGLESLAGDAPDTVLIHDAARPFVSAAVIDATLDQLDRTPGALVAVPVVDTLKRAADGIVAGTVDRSGLWRAQTPQGFRYDAILAAHRAAAGQALTDDAAVAEAAGLAVGVVSGAEDNFKVTGEDDLARAERLLAAGAELRTGMGYDVHAFGPGDHVWLCGVKVPHEAGLVGHSDADVGLHAVTDALLGAIGAGDIGVHFPPSDPRWKGAASDAFVRRAVELVADRGGAVVHVDLTLVCEAPRLRPHHEAMVARVAELLGVAPGRVSIKATTTDGLGFAGRREGIAGQAVATVRLPGDG